MAAAAPLAAGVTAVLSSSVYIGSPLANGTAAAAVTAAALADSSFSSVLLKSAWSILILISVELSLPP